MASSKLSSDICYGFSQDDFNAELWINNYFNTINTTDDSTKYHTLEKATSALLAQLDTFFYEDLNEFYSSIKSFHDNFSFVTNSIESMRIEAQNVIKQISNVCSHLEQDESFIEFNINLRRLDKSKARVEKFEQILLFLKRWNLLSAQLDADFAQLSITALSKKISEMKSLLKDIQETPNFEAKLDRYQTIEQNFIKKAFPILEEAHAAHDFETIQEILRDAQELNIFAIIEDSYYISKKQLLSDWPSEDIIKNFTELHEKIIEITNEEAEWIFRIFGSSAELIHLKLLINIYEPIASHLCEHLNSLPDSYWLTFGVFYSQRTANQFQLLDKTLDGYYKNYRNEETSTALKAPIKTLFHRLYQPLVPVLLDFKRLQSSKFANFLNALFDSKPLREPSDATRFFRHSIGQLFSFLLDNLKDCINFSSGILAVDFFSSVDACISDYAEKLVEIVLFIDKKMNASHFQECEEYLSASFILLRAVGDILRKLDYFEKKSLKKFVQFIDLLPTLTNERLDAPCNFLLLSELASHVQEFNINIETVKATEKNNNEVFFLANSWKHVQMLNNEVQKLVSNILLFPVVQLLGTIPNLQAWSALKSNASASSASFSIRHQTYISQIGQRLLDLPQQLEPLILKKNEPESFCMFLALSKGATPNVEQASTAFTHQVANDEGFYASTWLEAVVSKTKDLYVQSILAIPQLTDLGANQLCVDLEYLLNILSIMDMESPPELLYILQYCKHTKEETFQIEKETNPKQKIYEINKVFGRIRKYNK